MMLRSLAPLRLRWWRASAEAVAGEVDWMAEATHVLLHDECDALGGQGPEEPAVPVNPEDHRPFGDPSSVSQRRQPARDRWPGAAVNDLDPPAPSFLVGLGPAEVHEEAFGDLVDVGHGDAGQYAAPEAAVEAEGEQQPVAVPSQVDRQGGDGGLECRRW